MPASTTSRKGNCWDNAVAESFFATIKGEMLDHETFETRAEATAAIADYVDAFHNVHRLDNGAALRSEPRPAGARRCERERRHAGVVRVSDAFPNPPMCGTARRTRRETVNIPDDVLALLREPSLCYVSTIMPDGSPQLTQTWVDTDGTHALINSVQTHQKVKNLQRDPRITIAVSNPKQLIAYRELRGRVIDITTEGGVEHIEKLSQRYLGTPYQWYGGRDQVRVILTMEVDKILGVR
jgi:PPOX class probable F420-dependent enzyme